MLRRLLLLFVATALTAQLATAEGKIRKPLPAQEVIDKLPADGGAEFNRLVFEQSPYLLQHARNPVDWWAWSDAAFKAAAAQDKAVFLSVGYSTCHWCHVMEHESFEDDEVAELMNEHFICIKVDREERPDIDNVYMTVTQAMTGRGGWPMTVVMTPERKPFFAGTYFPKGTRGRRPGMMTLIPKLSNTWKNQRDEVTKSANQISTMLKEMTSGQPGDAMDESDLKTAFNQLTQRFDKTHGGFARTPKFPVPHNLQFLLRYASRTGDKSAVAMVEKTLTAMRAGGIFDHIGFGFHRYSTDVKWLLPHFEKMLYDQALLAIAYTEAYQVTDNPLYKQTADEIFTYVLRDMTDPKGGFYSAEDADSEGEEGLFYIWTTKEIVDILGEVDGERFNKVYNIEKGGNFKDESSGRSSGRNIPHITSSVAEIAAAEDMTQDSYQFWLEGVRKRLFDVRERRIHPFKDDKILTDWNGLMIAAFAKAGQAFNNPSYTKAAQRAADFILADVQDDEGRLLKRYRQGKAGLPAHLEDYAFFVWGLIDLYEATLDAKYLAEAVRLNDYTLDHFWDDEKQGLFMVADTSEQLLVRSKDIYDGAIPSGNSVATLNLMRLARMTTTTEYEDRAAGVIEAFSGNVEKNPSAHTQLMLGLDFMVGPSYEVVVVGDPKSNATKKMLGVLRTRYLPRKVLVFRPTTGNQHITKIATYTEMMTATDNTATAYVCRNFTCDLPTTSIEKMLESLAK
jgi:uncharacterized protein YyaL (SSP411 family)